MNTSSTPAAVHVSRQVQRQIARLQAKNRRITPAEAARRRLEAAKIARAEEAARRRDMERLAHEAVQAELREIGLEPLG